MAPKSSPLDRIQRLSGKAIGDFNLLQDGDRVLVALSGGKDSWAMLQVLLCLQRKAPIRYTLIPVTIHPGFPDFDCSELHTAVAQLGLHLHVEMTNNVDIIAEHKRPGTSYCAFCARLRRGAMYTTASRLGCNKIALGHHLDDFIETLLLNQFFSGTIAAMSPDMLANSGKHRVIRPLVYVEEQMIHEWIDTVDLPLLYCGCPQAQQLDQKRQKIKQLLSELQLEIPQIKKSLLNAMRNVQPRHLLDPHLISSGSQTGNPQTPAST